MEKYQCILLLFPSVLSSPNISISHEKKNSGQQIVKNNL